MTDSLVPHADSLLAHADFVRRVARAALQGDRDVDDVVQETWLAALRSAPRDPKVLRAWLAGIARRQAANRIRRESALRRRQAAAARPEDTATTADMAARVEVGRRLVDAVLELEEPYRDAVLMRHYENLPPREIARRLGLPVNTVRTHVRRGLAKLRVRLERECGGSPDGAVCALLVVSGGTTGHVLPSLAGATGGVIVMKKVLVAMAVLFLILGATLWMGVPMAQEQESGTPPTLLAEGDGEGAEAAPTLVGRPTAAAGPEAAADLPRSRRAGRVIAKDTRQPLAGVPVYAVPIDLARTAVVTRTDAQGWFALDGVAEGRASVFALGAGWISDGTAAIEKGGFDPTVQALPLQGALVLEATPCATVEGVVQDEAGAPVAGAAVESLPVGVDRRPRRPHDPLVVTTDASGVFHHDALIPGRGCAFRARHPSHPPATVRVPVLRAGTSNSRIGILMEAGRVVPVAVVDAETGAGVAGAEVHAYWLEGELGHGGTWTTGPGGKAEVGPVPRTEVRILVQSGGYVVRDTPVWISPPDAGKPESVVTFELDPGGTLRGRVVAPSGVDAARARVEAHARGAHPSSAEFDVAANGDFEIRGLAAGAFRIVATVYERGRWYVGTAEATAPGHGYVVELVRSNDPFPAEPGGLERATQEVALRVLSPSGHLLRTGWIRFADEVAMDAVDLEDGSPRIVVARDGAGVRFELSDLGRDADGSPLGAGQYGPVRAVGGVLTLQVERGEAIRGQVTTTTARGVGGVRIRALPATPFDRDPDPQGVGETHTRADGRFVLQGLRREAYVLTFDVPAAYVPPDPLSAVAGGRDVGLVVQAGRSIRVRVVGPGGRPLVGALVTVAPDDEASEICRTPTDADGVATATRLVSGRTYQLVVHPPADRQHDLLLHVGAWVAHDVTIALRPGVVTTGRVMDGGAHPAAGVVVWYRVPGEPEASSVLTDAHGRFRIGPTPPGTLRLLARRRISDETSPPSAWDASVEAGSEDVELTLLP